MSPILYGLVGMTGVGLLNVLISLLNQKNEAFKVGFLIQIGNFLLTLTLFPILFKQNPGIEIFFSLLIAGASGALAFIFINKAFSEGKASINSPIISSWGMLTALLGFIVLGEDINYLKILGMILIVLGIFLSSLDLKYLLKNRNIAIIPGVKWSLFAAISLAVSFFTITYFTGSIHWYSVNLFTRFWTASSYILMGLSTRKPLKSYFSKIPLLILIAILIDTSSMLTINLGYTTSEPGIVSVLTSASPIPTLILSFLVLKESITKQQLLGILVVIVGIISLSLN